MSAGDVLAIVVDDDQVPDHGPLRDRAVHTLISCGAAVVVAALADAPALLAEHDPAVVLVHEAARAFTPAALIDSVIAEVRSGAGSVVPVLPMSDTVKRIGDAGLVDGTEDRDSLRTKQTPIGFRPDVLRARLADGFAGLATGARTIEGHPAALRVTTPFDAAVAAALTNGASDADR